MATLFERVRRWLIGPPTDLATASGAPLGSIPVSQSYDPLNALSAFGAFPWVHACIEAIAVDLSGVPLVLVQIGPDGGRTIVRSHPTLTLLARPHPQCSGVRFRRQLIADLKSTGNAYVRIFGTGIGRTLARMHPAEVRVVTNMDSALITGYQWGTVEVPVDEVIHIAGIGWETGGRSALGESPVRSLNDGLVASQLARRHASLAAKRGRLEMLLSPVSPTAALGKEAVKRLVDMFTTATQSGDGVLVLNKAVKATPLSFSPRELEYNELQTQVRDETLAVFNVPPVRVGLPGANYGTARAQFRSYWEALEALGRLIDAELTHGLAPPGFVIEHDFSRVDAAQAARTDRQTRATVWVNSFGVTPIDAAEYEGFADAPIPEGTTPANAQSSRTPPADALQEPQEAGIRNAVRGWLTGAGSRYAAAAQCGAELPTVSEVHRLAGCMAAWGVDEQVAEIRARQIVRRVHRLVRDHAAGAPRAIGIAGLDCFQHANAATTAAPLLDTH